MHQMFNLSDYVHYVPKVPVREENCTIASYKLQNVTRDKTSLKLSKCVCACFPFVLLHFRSVALNFEQL
jgi:hypothetical protein